MESLNGAVDEKYLRIRRFMERINIGLVSLVGCALNEVHGVTRDTANHNFLIIDETRFLFESI